MSIKFKKEAIPDKCYLCGHFAHEMILSLQVPGWETAFDLCRCDSCKLEFLRPLPCARQLMIQYGDDYYRTGYLEFEQKQRVQFRVLLDQLREHGASGPLLDVGAGVGLLVAVAREQGWVAEGIEPSGAACLMARERHGIELQQMEITDTSPKHTFGVVVLWQVLAHAREPLMVLRHAAKMLRPKGFLVMSFINWKDPNYRLGKALARWRHVNAIHIPTILWRFEEPHLRTLADRAGLRVEVVRYGPRAFRPAWGWKRNLLEKSFESYRKITHTSEELQAWCTATGPVAQ